MRSAVGIVASEIVTTEGIWEQRRVPVDATGNRARIRVDEQLCRVAAQALRRIPWPMHPEAISLAGADPTQIPVPAEGGAFRQVDVDLLAVVVEEAQLDTLGDLGKQREVGALAVPRRAERERLAGTHTDARGRCRGSGGANLECGVAHCDLRTGFASAMAIPRCARPRVNNLPSRRGPAMIAAAAVARVLLPMRA